MHDQPFDTLLAKYIAGTISEEEREMLFSRVVQSPHLKEQFETVAGMNALRFAHDFDATCESDFALLRKKSAGPRRLLSGVRRIAAVLAIGLFSAAASIYIHTRLGHNSEMSWIEMSTPLGGQTRLVLPDGTVAWVNARSELRYSSQYNRTDRLVHLSGEGFFEVAKNEELPFEVRSGEVTVRATGTQFNVRTYSNDDKWEVDLLEGGVEVEMPGRHLELTPDEKMVYDRTVNTALIEHVETDLAAQWTRGRLSFIRASIPEIYKMLERHFDVCIEIGCEELRGEQFMGSINMNMSLREILNYLDVDKKYEIKMDNKNVVVVKKGGNT